LVGGGRSASEDATELEKAWCPVIHDDFRLDRPAFETYARLNEPREQAPFLWNTTPNGYWMITRYDDIKEALQRPDVFSNRITSAIGKREQCLYLIPQNLDSQAHVDCRHDATEMFLGIIGLPVEDGAYPLPRVETSWPASSAVIRSPRPERPMSQAVLRAGHRSAPRGTGRRQDGLRLVSAPGEDGDELISRANALTLCMRIMLAGLDTKRSALGFMLLHLGTHDDDWRFLIELPGLPPGPARPHHGADGMAQTHPRARQSCWNPTTRASWPSAVVRWTSRPAWRRWLGPPWTCPEDAITLTE